ncbi:MAG: DUF6502 family protein [Woeseiaceae bacterium]
MSAEQYSQTTESLFKAIKWLCKPLIRLLISNGITFPQFRELLKGLYVEVAEQGLVKSGKDVSDSRLFILTGVHRKDIKRLRQNASDNNIQSTQTASLGGNIIARWIGKEEFLDKSGEPRCLSRNTENDLLGFDQLVTQVSKDIRPRTILDEWLHSGLVSTNENNEICLNKKAFVPTSNFAEQSFYLGRNVHDHLAACVHNMQSDKSAMLERSVYYTSLTPESITHLQDIAAAEGIALLQKLNQEALSRQEQDKNNENANYRMRFGCYWYDEKNETNPKMNGESK